MTRSSLTRTSATVAATLLFAALNVQLVSATGSIVDPEAGAQFKAYHLGIAAVCGIVALRARVMRWPHEVSLYVFGMALLATILGLVNEARPLLANAVVAVATLVGGAMLGYAAGAPGTRRALRYGAVLVLAAVVVKIIVYRGVLLAFWVRPNGHPNIPAFAGGGPNLEASWLALATAFFIGTPGLLPYAALSALVSGAYVSRGALLVTTFVVGLAWLAAPRWKWRQWLAAGVGAAAAVAGALIVAQRVDLGGGYVVERFQSIGEDPGSIGRLALWRGGLTVFAEHPLGVGLGNAVPAVRRATGADFPEDNLHNLYLQHLVETGLPGFILVGLLVSTTVLKFKRRGWRDPLLAYLVAYFALAALQFRGWEPLPWFIYGLWIGTETAEAERVRPDSRPLRSEA